MKRITFNGYRVDFDERNAVATHLESHQAVTGSVAKVFAEVAGPLFAVDLVRHHITDPVELERHLDELVAINSLLADLETFNND